MSENRNRYSGVWRGVSMWPIDPLLASPPGGSHDHGDDRMVDRTSGVEDGLDVEDDGGVEFDDVDTVDVRLTEQIEVAYERLYPRLLRLAFLVDTVEHAEEAVQDAFAKAYPKWSRIENSDTYMRMAVVNTCRRVQRRRMLVRRTASARVEHEVLAVDGVGDVVRALPMALRQVVVLRYYLQLSDQEISDTLDMPIGTVKSTLHRARARLRKELS
jgi:RNA polymerase sigma factor (sigma-70 family)